MKGIMLLLLLVLLLPLVVADEIPFEPMTLGMDIVEPSQMCRDEWNIFMGQQPEELINKYCDRVGVRVLVLLGLIALMWLAEPKMQKLFKDKGNEYFPYQWACFLYKWVGLGMMFIAMYAIGGVN